MKSKKMVFMESHIVVPVIKVTRHQLCMGRRKKQGPSLTAVSPDHPLHRSISPESGSDSTSDDLDLNTIIPTGTTCTCNVEVHFKLIVALLV